MSKINILPEVILITSMLFCMPVLAWGDSWDDGSTPKLKTSRGVVDAALPDNVMVTSLNESEKNRIEVVTYMFLDMTKYFDYIKADIDDNENLKIWFVPVKANITLREITALIAEYRAIVQFYPTISDAYFFHGEQGDEESCLYCLKSWVSYGDISDEEAYELIMKVQRTSKECNCSAHLNRSSDDGFTLSLINRKARDLAAS